MVRERGRKGQNRNGDIRWGIGVGLMEDHDGGKEGEIGGVKRSHRLGL